MELVKDETAATEEPRSLTFDAAVWLDEANRSIDLVKRGRRMDPRKWHGMSCKLLDMHVARGIVLCRVALGTKAKLDALEAELAELREKRLCQFCGTAD